MTAFEWPEPNGLTAEEIDLVLVGLAAASAASLEMAHVDRPCHFIAALYAAVEQYVETFRAGPGVFGDLEPGDFV